MIQQIEGRAWTPTKAVRALLMSHAPSREYLGDRLYPVVAPEGAALPLGVYRLAGTDRTGGHMTGNAGHAYREIEVRLFDQDYDALDAFAADFRLRLESWRGVEGGLKVRRIDIMDESDEPYERPEGGEDDPIYSRLFTLRLTQIEAATTLPDGSY